MNHLQLLWALAAAALMTTPTTDDPYQPMKVPAPPLGYVCYRADPPPVIDGKLDDPAWRDAPWTTDFVDIMGPSHTKPRFRTRAKMLWDDNYLYIAAELEEPHVWATLTEHDSVIFQDNDFEVFIDPDGDNHNYYEIEINALNTEWDLRLVKPYRDGGPALNSWEIPGLKTAVHINGTLNNSTDTDHGWTVEMAFPWKVLREFANRPAPPHDGDEWRINFSRVEWQIDIVDGKYQKVKGKPEDNWVWSPQFVVDMHRPERWGYVQFSRAAPGTAKFVRDPAEPARELLHRLYYLQRAFFGKNKRYAATPAELQIKEPVSLKLTPEGYEAFTEVHYPQGKSRTVHIRQDSLVWLDGNGETPRNKSK
jgi:hypothetical protein